MKKALIISYVFIAVLLTGLTFAFINIIQQNNKIVNLEKQLSQNNIQSTQVSLSQKGINANDVA